jgi:hypothetical protein
LPRFGVFVERGTEKEIGDHGVRDRVPHHILRLS